MRVCVHTRIYTVCMHITCLYVRMCLHVCVMKGD